MISKEGKKIIQKIIPLSDLKAPKWFIEKEDLWEKPKKLFIT